jgi:hypothetical protein
MGGYQRIQVMLSDVVLQTLGIPRIHVIIILTLLYRLFSVE